MLTTGHGLVICVFSLCDSSKLDQRRGGFMHQIMRPALALSSCWQFQLYRCVTWAVTPAIMLHFLVRYFRGRDCFFSRLGFPVFHPLTREGQQLTSWQVAVKKMYLSTAQDIDSHFLRHFFHSAWTTKRPVEETLNLPAEWYGSMAQASARAW